METAEFLRFLNEYKISLANCSLCNESSLKCEDFSCCSEVKLLILSDSPMDRSSEGYLLLEDLIKANGISKEDYFISSVIKCSGVDKNPENFKNCRRHLAVEFKLLKPKVILLLGSGAHEAFFGVRPDGNRIRGVVSSVNGFNIMTTCNPLIASDNVNYKLMMYEDMEKIAGILNQL